MARIAIIGLGLIGGSLGASLMRTRGRGLEIVGYDADSGTRREARRLSVVDDTTASAGEAVQGAGLVIVAVPPLAIDDVFREIAPHLGSGAAVTDTASTKAMVMRWAERYLPDHVSFVGGHPMAGKSEHGVGASDPELFKDAPYVICPAPRATEQAVKSVVSMVQGIGANEIYVDAEEHDRLVAGISHLPLMAAVALFGMVRRSDGYMDLAKLAGPAFESMTRVAGGDPVMSTGIAFTNRANIQHWLDRYIVELHELRKRLDETPETLLEEFGMHALNHSMFESGDDLRRGKPMDFPDLEDQMVAMLGGGWAVDKMREFWGRYREVEEAEEQERGRARGR